MTRPLITVALPVFNGEATLALAIESILLQSYQNWEMIILDDKSTDESLKVMRSFDDSRIQLVVGERNTGLSSRLNQAVKMAQGKYFARMDQDDIAFPDRFLKQVAYLEEHQGVDLLGSSSMVFSGDGDVLGTLPVRSSHDDICAKPWNGFYLPHPTWMGKVSWFSENRYDSNSDGAEDQQLLFRTYQSSSFACLEEPLLAYREVRSFKKMFKARRVLLKAFVSVAIQDRKFFMVIKVICTQSMKMIADILNQYLNISSLRNQLNAPSSDCLSQWKRVRFDKSSNGE